MLGVICQDDNHLSFKTMKTFQFIDAWNKVGQSSSVSSYTLICIFGYVKLIFEATNISQLRKLDGYGIKAEPALLGRI